MLIRLEHGEMSGLVLMDNNTVASPKFDKIIDEVIEAGFGGQLFGDRSAFRWSTFRLANARATA